jgi:hypothetical protein
MSPVGVRREKAAHANSRHHDRKLNALLIRALFSIIAISTGPPAPWKVEKAVKHLALCPVS